jgi:arginyl-tRNA synthetase
MLETQERLAEAVRGAARRAFDVSLESVAFHYPPRVELGDLALTTPFDVAKRLRRKPRELAEKLARELAEAPGVRRAEVAGGGYVNLFLDRGPFARSLHGTLRDPVAPLASRGQVIVEHTSINPNKAAHIGHLRNACLGDGFVRLLRDRGFEVGIQNYIDDTGVQVADVVVGFVHLEKMSLPEVERIDGRFDYYCWDLYARVGDFYAADPDRKALQAEVLHAIEEGTSDTARLGEYVATRIVGCHLATMARLGIRYDLLAHESDILRLHFWNRAFELLKAKGAIRHETDGKNAGCWVLPMQRTFAEKPEGPASSSTSRNSLPRGPEVVDAPARGRQPSVPKGHRIKNEDDKIIVRSNGTVTYTGKDIAYQLWKLGLLDRDFRYRRYCTDPDGHELWATTSLDGEAGAPVFGHARAVYNVIDVGQSYPQRVVRAGVAALGYQAEAEGSHHLAYEKVVLSPATARALGYEAADEGGAVKVSGRKGLGVKADDLLDALLAKARAEVDARDPHRDPEAREATASAVARGALRYFMLRFSRTRIITFDMEEALAFTGETGPYVQNAVVRARNILGKLEAQGHHVAELLTRACATDLGAALSGEEGNEIWSLLLLMSRTDEVEEQAIRGEDVALVAKHAFIVAQAFHSYYQRPQHSVLHAETDDLRAVRTLVVDTFVRQMEVLLGLLGIPVPERM